MRGGLSNFSGIPSEDPVEFLPAFFESSFGLFSIAEVAAGCGLADVVTSTWHHFYILSLSL